MGIVLESSCPPLQLSCVKDALLDEQAVDGSEPAFVVGRAEVLVWGDALDAVAEFIKIVEALSESRELDRKDDPLPVGMKERLVWVVVDEAEAVHSAEIVDSVHSNAFGGGWWTRIPGERTQ